MHRIVCGSLCAAVAALAAAAPAAAAPHVKRQVIVKYADGEAGKKAKKRAKAEAGVERDVGRVRGVGADVVRVKGDAEAAARKLDRMSGVVYAETDRILQATSIPNDPRFGGLYGLHNANDADLDAPEGWDVAFGAGAFPSGGGVKVGVIDTGIDAAHEDLAGKNVACAGVRSFGFLGLFGGDPTVVSGRCADDNDHGTHVSGTIAAITNNGRGVAGVAPNAQLVTCKALSSGGSGSTSGIANCIDWVASQGVEVISMSLGGGSSTTMRQAVQRAYKSGTGALVVAAAGNDGNSTVSYPAGYAEAMSVAATDRNDQRASFSNANSDVEIAAAGVDVLSTRRGGGYVAYSGTSMATPHVAGVAALLAAENPALTAAQLRSRLTATADDKGAAGRDPQYGWGRVNLLRALRGR